MKENSNFISALIFVVISLCLAGCGNSGKGTGPNGTYASASFPLPHTSDSSGDSWGTSPHPTSHVWEYLEKFGNEPEGYAAYSYILTGRDGSGKYAELVKLIQSSTSTASSVAESKIFLPQELNIFLIPAIKADGSAYKPDYEVSKSLLGHLGARSKLSFDRPGPFIITLSQPISSIPRRGAGEIDMLYVDLTNVSQGAVA